jgi:hypothetical protein
LTPTSETLVLLLTDKGHATYDEAKDLVDAVAKSEIQAAAEQMLRRIGRGEGLHYHGPRDELDDNDVLTRGSVVKVIKQEAGL